MQIKLLVGTHLISYTGFLLLIHKKLLINDLKNAALINRPIFKHLPLLLQNPDSDKSVAIWTNRYQNGAAYLLVKLSANFKKIENFLNYFNINYIIHYELSIHRNCPRCYPRRR